MKLITTYTLEDCLAYLSQHRTRQAYAIIGVGLWLIKAAALHSIPQAQRGQGRKSVATLQPDEAEAGFLQWLTENVTGPESGFGLSRSSAYNYMRAAAALGLTADDDDAKLLELQEQNVLEGRKLRDLYKPAQTLGSGGKPSPPADAPSSPDDWWDEWVSKTTAQFAPESKEVQALYQLPPQKLDALEEQTRRALDVIKEVRQALAKPSRR